MGEDVLDFSYLLIKFLLEILNQNLQKFICHSFSSSFRL